MYAFKERIRAFEDEIQSKESQLSQREFAHWLINAGFEAAVRLTLDETTFSNDVAAVYAAHNALQGNSKKEQWPESNTVFGQYINHGKSAHSVAIQFIQSIRNSCECAKVESLERFDIEQLTEDDFQKWKIAIAKELHRVLSLDLWPKAIRVRDASILRDSMSTEAAKNIGPSDADEDKEKVFSLLMDCWMEINNLLPRPVDNRMDIDRVEITAKLLDAYAELVDLGYMDIGGDCFANQTVEFEEIVTTSNGKLLADLAARTLDRVLSLASSKPIPFHKFDPRLSLDDLAKLKKVKSQDIAYAAGMGSDISSELDKIMNRFVAESETANKDATKPPIPPQSSPIDPPEPDGPCDPFSWRIDGVVIECSLPNKAYMLAELLWSAKSKSMSIDSALEQLYGHDHMGSVKNIQDQATKINNFFREHNLKWTVIVKRPHVFLKNEYPKALFRKKATSSKNR